MKTWYPGPLDDEGKLFMAEREGFEPSLGRDSPTTGLANPPLKPLGYLSL